MFESEDDASPGRFGVVPAGGGSVGGSHHPSSARDSWGGISEKGPQNSGHPDAERSESDPNAPTADGTPAPNSHRERLVRFYQRYAPERLETPELLDNALFAYKGREAAMFVALVDKYGPEPMDEKSVVVFSPLVHPRPSVAGAKFGTPQYQNHQDSWAAKAPLIRRRLVFMYLEYAPHKVLMVDEVMTRYQTQKDGETRLFEDLVALYGPEPALSERKDRLSRFYEYYAPSKIAGIDDILLAFGAETDVLFNLLEEQYGPEPAFRDDNGQKLDLDTATMETTRLRLQHFYGRYAPDKLVLVDDLVTLVHPRGDVSEAGEGPRPPMDHHELFTVLEERYTTGVIAGTPSGRKVGEGWRKETQDQALNQEVEDEAWLANKTSEQRVEMMYRFYAPEKLSTVSRALEAYKGREEEMLQILAAKYGPEPTLQQWHDMRRLQNAVVAAAEIEAKSPAALEEAELEAELEAPVSTYSASTNYTAATENLRDGPLPGRPRRRVSAKSEFNYAQYLSEEVPSPGQEPEDEAVARRHNDALNEYISTSGGGNFKRVVRGLRAGICLAKRSKPGALSNGSVDDRGRAPIVVPLSMYQEFGEEAPSGFADGTAGSGGDVDDLITDLSGSGNSWSRVQQKVTQQQSKSKKGGTRKFAEVVMFVNTFYYSSTDVQCIEDIQLPKELEPIDLRAFEYVHRIHTLTVVAEPAARSQLQHEMEDATLALAEHKEHHVNDIRLADALNATIWMEDTLRTMLEDSWDLELQGIIKLCETDSDIFSPVNMKLRHRVLQSQSAQNVPASGGGLTQPVDLRQHHRILQQQWVNFVQQSNVAVIGQDPAHRMGKAALEVKREIMSTVNQTRVSKRPECYHLGHKVSKQPKTREPTIRRSPSKGRDRSRLGRPVTPTASRSRTKSPVVTKPSSVKKAMGTLPATQPQGFKFQTSKRRPRGQDQAGEVNSNSDTRIEAAPAKPAQAGLDAEVGPDGWPVRPSTTTIQTSFVFGAPLSSSAGFDSSGTDRSEPMHHSTEGSSRASLAALDDEISHSPPAGPPGGRRRSSWVFGALSGARPKDSSNEDGPLSGVSVLDDDSDQQSDGSKKTEGPPLFPEIL